MDEDNKAIDINEITMDEENKATGLDKIAKGENPKKSRGREIGLAALIVILVAVLIGIVIWIILGARLDSINKADEVNYAIRYYASALESYNIKAKDDYIVVEKLEQPQCIQAPCDPIVIDRYRVDYADEYRELFEKLFKDQDDKYISITASEIPSDERVVLGKIVESKR